MPPAQKVFSWILLACEILASSLLIVMMRGRLWREDLSKASLRADWLLLTRREADRLGIQHLVLLETDGGCYRSPDP